MNEQPTRPQRGSASGSNSGTYLAVYGVGAVSLAFLGFLGIITSGVVFFGVIAVVLFIGGVSLFHYLTWGWWLSSLRDEELKSDERLPPQ